MKKHLIFYTFLVTLVFGFATESSAKVITVKKGDSMWTIAQRYKVSFQEVLKLNKQHHIDVNLIHPFDLIYLPDKGTGTSTSQASSSDDLEPNDITAEETQTTSQAQEVLSLVNAERKKQGLSSLTLSDKLTSIATMKSKDMAVNNYFDHTSPTYGSPFQMLQTYGVTYSSAGENIAAGQTTAQEVMNSWMNSSGHRANILNKNYTELGVGYYKGGSYGVYWTQEFIKP